MNTLTMSLESSGQEVGYICWYLLDSTLFLNVLHVHDIFQKKGYGTLLIKTMYKTFVSPPLYVCVDDCSDLSGSPDSIYNKMFSLKLYSTENVLFIHEIH